MHLLALLGSFTDYNHRFPYLSYKAIPFHIPTEIQYNSLLRLPCWDFSVTMRHQKKKLIKLQEKWLIIQLKRNNKKIILSLRATQRTQKREKLINFYHYSVRLPFSAWRARLEFVHPLKGYPSGADPLHIGNYREFPQAFWLLQEALQGCKLQILAWLRVLSEEF